MFTRLDQDSLRGGILTHPGIDENGVLAMAVPRTNRLPLLTLTGTGTSDQRVEGSNPSGRATLSTLELEPDLAEASNASFSEWLRRRQPMCQMPSPSARIVRCSPRPN